MDLTRYEPFRTLRRHTHPEWLPRFLESDWLEPFFRETESWVPSGFVPAVDISEKDDEYVLEAELPGMKKEDIHIDLKDGILTISGDRKYEREETRDNYNRVERCYGSFSRSFTLPDHVKVDRIDAAYKDGILTVTLPKGEEAKPKHIDVKIQ